MESSSPYSKRLPIGWCKRGAYTSFELLFEAFPDGCTLQDFVNVTNHHEHLPLDTANRVVDHLIAKPEKRGEDWQVYLPDLRPYLQPLVQRTIPYCTKLRLGRFFDNSSLTFRESLRWLAQGRLITHLDFVELDEDGNYNAPAFGGLMEAALLGMANLVDLRMEIPANPDQPGLVMDWCCDSILNGIANAIPRLAQFQSLYLKGVYLTQSEPLHRILTTPLQNTEDKSITILGLYINGNNWQGTRFHRFGWDHDSNTFQHCPWAEMSLQSYNGMFKDDATALLSGIARALLTTPGVHEPKLKALTWNVNTIEAVAAEEVGAAGTAMEGHPEDGFLEIVGNLKVNRSLQKLIVYQNCPSLTAHERLVDVLKDDNKTLRIVYWPLAADIQPPPGIHQPVFQQHIAHIKSSLRFYPQLNTRRRVRHPIEGNREDLGTVTVSASLAVESVVAAQNGEVDPPGVPEYLEIVDGETVFDVTLEEHWAGNFTWGPEEKASFMYLSLVEKADLFFGNVGNA